MRQSNIRDFLKFYGVYLIWMLISIPCALIVKFMNIDLDNKFNYAIIESILTIVIFIVVVIGYRRNLGYDLKKLSKRNVFEILIQVFKLFLIGFGLQMLSGMVVVTLLKVFGLPLTSSDNNNLATELIKSAPVLMGIGAVILAPTYEETIMRLGLRNGLKNKKVFIAVSGIIFGIMHVVDSSLVILSLPLIGFLIDYIISSKFTKNKKILLSITSVVFYLVLIIGIFSIVKGGIVPFLTSVNYGNLIYAIEYITLGIYLAYIYVKHDNIYLNIGTHILINALGTIILFFK